MKRSWVIYAPIAFLIGFGAIVAVTLLLPQPPARPKPVEVSRAAP